MDAAPGRLKPITSASEVMVEAVPMVMQWPGERALEASLSMKSAFEMAPALNSMNSRLVSVPLPSGLPR